jgi:hypothetical protein
MDIYFILHHNLEGMIEEETDSSSDEEDPVAKESICECVHVVV